MKYLLTFIIICSVHCVAQSYVPFPIGHSYWQYDNYYEDMGAHAHGIISLFSTNEIIVANGKTYYKVKKNGDDFIGIREENKRVYCYKIGYPELILFDFNVAVGDMMPLVFSGHYFFYKLCW